MKKKAYKKIIPLAGIVLTIVFLLTGCGQANEDQASEKIIIYSNADDEAIAIMEARLDANDLKGKYKIQVFGTSELGGKLSAEGTTIEADVLTLSTFYIESAKENFINFNVKKDGLVATQDFHSPILGLEGSLIVNTEVMKDEKIAVPTSIKDLTKPEYQDLVSIPDLRASSTGWLFVQAILATYGEEEGKNILAAILKNVGPHLEDSGSAPIKKARAGEVAIAFGLRQQGIKDEQSGLPIKVIDVAEGNYLLTESVAVVNHKANGKNENSKKVADILANDTRKELIKLYPTALFKDETEKSVDANRTKRFPKTLTVDLLKKHQAIFEEALALAK